jgi:Enoyl-(Acyl carrier protein) reductase
LHELADTDLKQARRAFELRYWSALATVKYGSPQIRKGGSIVLTTGVAGRRPRSGWVIAASVCGTIEALTRALAIELAPIRVNAVSPGVVRTNLWQNMSSSEREQLFESLGKRLPVGRVGEAHDIAQAYLFLMQEGFSTGQTVVVDGGTVRKPCIVGTGFPKHQIKRLITTRSHFLDSLHHCHGFLLLIRFHKIRLTCSNSAANSTTIRDTKQNVFPYHSGRQASAPTPSASPGPGQGLIEPTRQIKYL